MPITLALAFTGPPALAHRGHGPHVHGQAQLTLALEGKQLSITLQSAGIGLLDFEHAPRNAAERRALNAVLATLKQPTWLLFPRSAQCRLLAASVTAPGYEADHVDSPHEGEAHGDIHAEYTLRCADAKRLDHVQVLLPRNFPGLRKVIVDFTMPSGQGSAEVDATNPRVDL